MIPFECLKNKRLAVPLPEKSAEYAKLREELAKLQNSLKEQKSSKNISEALQTSKAIEQLIKSRILPANKAMRSDLRGLLSHKETIYKKSFMSISKDIDELEQQISKAEGDFVKIEVFWSFL